jgi:hypothetical protein
MADGLSKLITIKKETTRGVKASNTGGQLLQRVTGSFQGDKEVYVSNSMRPSQMLGDQRHGTRKATGDLSVEIQCLTNKELIAAAMRRDFAADAATTGAVVTISVSSGATAFTRSSGSFITDGFKVGRILTATGIAASADNTKALIVSVAALTMHAIKLDGTAYTTASAGASITLSHTGKYTYVPQTGHTNDSFTVEEWHPDLAVPKGFCTLGQQVNTLAIDYKPNAMGTFQFGFLGSDFEIASSTRYFASPTAVPSEGVHSGGASVLSINGAKVTNCTGFSLNINNGISQESVVGSSAIGAVSRAKSMISGSMTLLFTDSTYTDAFSNEGSLEVAYASVSTGGSGFSFYCASAKVGKVTKDDGEKVIVVTVPFDVLESAGSSVITATNLVIGDTQA